MSIRDIGAAIVVFLVALPLCLGVALASLPVDPTTGEVPVGLGIISGVVGGVIVGALAGSPLQVSGPAAGLIASVLVIVNGWGLQALGLAVIISGALQLAAALFKLGPWFRAVSPALIGGMLAGIGVIIVMKMLHMVVGATAPMGGLNAALAIPAVWHEALSNASGQWSAGIGLLTVVLLVGWSRLTPKRLKMIPGPLVAVLSVTILVAVLDLPVATVDLPGSLLGSLNVPTFDSLSLLTDLGFIGASVALGMIAAAESLLCANATDLLHKGPRTNYNRELLALGVGNVVAGALGALPVTGVIVRSSANIDAGAQTRWAAIIHGFMLLILVAAAPWLLEYIPVPALAGTLVYVGGKLLAPQKLMQLRREGGGEAYIFVITVGAIFFVGLLWGILIGLAAALLKLLYAFSHVDIDVVENDGRWDVDIHGAATFVQLPRIASALEQIPEDAEVHVHLGGLAYVDHACAELLRQHERIHEDAGGKLITEWDEVTRLRDTRPLVGKTGEVEVQDDPDESGDDDSELESAPG